ncbi:unnamed protein product [Calypogeia fissa]
MAERGPHSSDFDKVLISMQEPLECRRVHAAMNGSSALAVSFRATWRFMPQTEGKEIQFYLQAVELEQGLERPITDSGATAVGAGSSELRPPPPPPPPASIAAPPLERFSGGGDDWLLGLDTQALLSGSTPIRSRVTVLATSELPKRKRGGGSTCKSPPLVQQQRRTREESNVDEDQSDDSRGHCHKQRR